MTATDIAIVGDGMAGMVHGLPTGEESGLAVVDITGTSKGKEAFRLNFVGNTIGYKQWDSQLDIKFDGYICASTGGTTSLSGISGAGAAMASVIASTTNTTGMMGITTGKVITRPGGTITYNQSDWAKANLPMTRFPYMSS